MFVAHVRMFTLRYANRKICRVLAHLIQRLAPVGCLVKYRHLFMNGILR